MVTSAAERKSGPGSGPVLIVAALKRELVGVARLDRSDVALLDTGEGPANALNSLKEWLATQRARAVVNIGLAGSLSRSLQTGDLVVAREVHGSGRVFDATRSLLFERAAGLSGVRPGMAITVNRIVWEAAEKRRLASSLGNPEVAWVDMESSAVAAVCESAGLPYLILRAISDEMNEDLPLDFNRCRDKQGRVRTAKVIRQVLLRPRAVGELLRLKGRADLCVTKLTSTIAEMLSGRTL